MGQSCFKCSNKKSKPSFLQNPSDSNYDGSCNKKHNTISDEGSEVNYDSNAYETIEDASSNIRSIDPYCYISMIKQHILSQCDESFHLRLKPEYQKSMIQKLLEIPNKVQFNKLLRDTKKEIDFTKMAQFTRDILHPHIRSLSDEIKSEKIPNIDLEIEKVLAGPAAKGNGTFARIATGKLYRGKLVDMLQDIAPELLPIYHKAMILSTDTEVFLRVIESISQERRKNDDELDPVKILAARSCIQYFSSIDDATSADRSSTHNSGTTNGIKCEEVCVNWLHHRHRDTQNSVLQNVHVSPKSPSKYASAIGRTKVSEFNGNDSSFVASTGVLWTNINRNKVCCEFDALVIQCADHNEVEVEGATCSADNVQLVEVWEAKFTLNPSTLRDAITKKLPAMKSILDDKNSSLLHAGSEYRLNGEERGRSSLTFGIFGLEILPPAKAVWQLLNSMAIDVLTKDAETVLNAIENGFVVIERELVCDQLRILKEVLENIGDVKLLIKLDKLV